MEACAKSMCLFYTGNRDYTPALELLAFQVGSEDGSQQCVNISILEDTEMEKTEIFYVNLFVADAAIVIVN